MIPSKSEINECVMENVVPNALGKLAEAYLSGEIGPYKSEEEIVKILDEKLVSWKGTNHIINSEEWILNNTEEVAKALTHSCPGEVIEAGQGMTREQFRHIVCEHPPSIAKDSGQPEWSVKELDRLYDALNVLKGEHKSQMEKDQERWFGKEKSTDAEKADLAIDIMALKFCLTTAEERAERYKKALEKIAEAGCVIRMRKVAIQALNESGEEK